MPRFPHLMSNIVWNHLGWTDMDENHAGKSQFKYTRENPDDHCDAYIFSQEALERREVLLPFNIFPKRYVNGEGMVFVQARNPDDKTRYIVGFFSGVSISDDPEDWCSFSCDLAGSARLAFPIRLDMARHCPLLVTGKPRKQIVGENNFNYVEQKWAVNILEDAFMAHYSHSPKEARKHINPIGAMDAGTLITKALQSLGVSAERIGKLRAMAKGNA